METCSAKQLLTIRTLAVDEFPRLKSVADGFTPDPASSIAIVAEENGEIVGRMLLLNMVHIEGTWVREDKRNGSVGYRLMGRTMEEAKKAGCSTLMAYTLDSDTKIADYMTRLGYTRQPLIVWAKGI